MKISVSESHIANGDTTSHSTCAMALAFASALKSLDLSEEDFKISTGTCAVMVKIFNDKWTTFPLPPNAVNWQEVYYRGQHVEPITFDTDEFN